MTASNESLSGDVKPVARPSVRLLWLLIVLALIAVATTWILLPPRFTAKAVVYAESPAPKVPLEIRQPLVPLEIMSRFVADQVVLLKDESLLSEIVQDEAIRETEWFRSQPGDSHQEKAKEALEKLKDDLVVEQIPDKNFLSVSFSTRNSKDAPVIVNTAVDRYLAKVKGESYSKLGAELKEATATQTHLNKDLQLIQTAKQEYITKKLGAPGVTQGLSVVGEALCTFSAEAARLEAEKLTCQAVYENLSAVGAASIPIAPTTRIAIEQDPRMVQLRSRRLELELEMAASQPENAASQPENAANNRELDRLKRQLQVMDDKLTSLAAQLESEARDYQVNSAETAYLNAMQAELKVRDRLMVLEEQQRDIDRGMAEYRQLEEKQMLLEDRLARINDYISQLQMIRGAQGTVQIRQIGFARPPESLDYERQVQFTLTALAIPVAYGILLILIRLVRGPKRTSH